MTDRQYFLLRRLHSLFGVFPLGLFLVNHLLTNASSMAGAAFFEHKVSLIHSLGPALPAVEAVFIFIPLMFHICLGIYIATQARAETSAAIDYPRNLAYRMQRWSGWAALVFIAYHVLHLRFFHDMQETPFSIYLAKLFTEGTGAFPGPFWIIAYLVGGAATVYHFANGLCTFCMTWGITVGPQSQRYMSYAALAVGLFLMVLLVASIAGFILISPEADNVRHVQELRAIHAKH